MDGGWGLLLESEAASMQLPQVGLQTYDLRHGLWHTVKGFLAPGGGVDLGLRFRVYIPLGCLTDSFVPPCNCDCATVLSFSCLDK